MSKTNVLIIFPASHSASECAATSWSSWLWCGSPPSSRRQTPSWPAWPRRTSSLSSSASQSRWDKRKIGPLLLFGLIHIFRDSLNIKIVKVTIRECAKRLVKYILVDSPTYYNSQWKWRCHQYNKLIFSSSLRVNISICVSKIYKDFWGLLW